MPVLRPHVNDFFNACPENRLTLWVYYPNIHSIMATSRTSRGRPSPADRRDAILDAALRCFVERGFYGTAIPQIAKRAGIASGTIYHYFDSKEALVNALYRKWKSDVARRVFTAFPQWASSREQFRAMWSEMVEFARAHPEAFAFLELHNHTSYLDAESQAMENNLKDFARGMIARAQTEGALKSAPADLLMELVFGAFNGMLRAHWEDRLELTDEVVAAAGQACWDTVATHPQK